MRLMTLYGRVLDLMVSHVANKMAYVSESCIVSWFQYEI